MSSLAPVGRILPLEAPYPKAVQDLFDRVMPAGMEPLLLFRTLARSARLFPRFMGAGVLDRGPIPLRDRELAILRTTARCGSEYEWGVHVSAFGTAAKLSEAQVVDSTRVPLDSALWTPRDLLVLELTDALHERCSVEAALWQRLSVEFTQDQILELIYIAGFYHLVSFLVNGLALPREPSAAKFPGGSQRALAGAG